MRRNRPILLAFSMALVTLSVGVAGRSWARQEHPGHDHAGHNHGEHAQPSPERGGTVTATEHYRFEVVLRPDGLRVYPRGDVLTPDVISRLKARAYFLMPGAKAYGEPYPLRPVTSSEGQPADALGLDVDLGSVPTDGTKITFQVWGLPDPAETKAEFTVPFAMGESTEIRAVKATEADQIGVAAQATCPISDEDLNAMGGPIKVSRGEESLFICCQGCLDPIKAEPERYFGSVISASRASESDERAVAEQGTCPISGKGLDSMGGPIKVSRSGNSVFVCCPACIDAVKADADRYLGSPATADNGG